MKYISLSGWIIRWVSFLLLLVLTGCVTQKKLFTLGKQQMEVGMYDEATETLIRALKKKKNNVEVQLTLRNCAVVVFDQKTDHIADAYGQRELQEAIDYYQYLQSLQKRLEEVGVIVDIPVRALSFYNQSKETINEQRNIDAQKALTQKDYSNAARLFRRILELEPNHTAAKEGLKIAVNEPILEQGMSLYDAGKYRAAYEHFKQVSQYKNGRDMLNLSLEKGRARYLFVPENLSDDGYFNSLIEEIKRNRTSPFLVAVTYPEYRPTMEQYGTKFKDLFYYTPATKALSDIGKFSAIIQVYPLATKINRITLKRQRYKGFNEKTEEIKKEDGTKEKKITYRKVYYTVVSTSNPQTVNSSIRIRMMNPKDGAILFSKDYAKSYSEELCYIEYDGDIRNLKAGEWAVKELPFVSSKDKIYEENHSMNRTIRDLRNAQRSLPDPNQILSGQLTDIRKEIVTKIVNSTLKD